MMTFKCSTCKKDVDNFKFLGSFRLELQYTTFSELGHRNIQHRVTIQSYSSCKECMEKITGTNTERLNKEEKELLSLIADNLINDEKSLIVRKPINLKD